MFLLWALKSTCNIFWICCDVIHFTYFLATCFWCLFLIICFSYSFLHVLFVMCLYRFYTHSFLNYSLCFSEASSYWTSPSKEIPMGSSLVWSQSCVYVKSAVHKGMYHQSLSFPSSQTNYLLQRWFSRSLPLASQLCHFLIPSRCHVSSHHLLMYPNASDSNKGCTIEPFEVCERILLLQACLRPAGGHFPLKSSCAAKGLCSIYSPGQGHSMPHSLTHDGVWVSVSISVSASGGAVAFLACQRKGQKPSNVFHSNRIHEEFRLHNAASQREGGSEDSVSQGRALYC